MLTSPTPEPARLTERAWVVANHLIMVAMLACAAAPAVRIAERLAPGWDGNYLIVFCAGVALEALLAERLFQRHFAALGVLRVWLYRALEVAALLVLLKLGQFLHRDAGGLWAGVLLFGLRLQEMLRARAGAMPGDLFGWPAAGVLDAEFGFGLVLVIAVWAAGGWFASSLLALEGDAQLFEHERDAQIPAERGEARRRLLGNVFTLGALVLALTAVLRQDLAVVGVRSPASTGGLLNLLLYFSLGFLLIAQSRFAVLRAQWGLERIAVRPQMVWRWAGYTLLLLLAVDALASLLPTGYSFGLLDLIGVFIAGLFLAFQWVIFLVTLLFGLVMGLLARLFPASAPPPAPPATPPPFTPPPAEAFALSAQWRTLIFWAVFLLVFALTFYFLYRRGPDFQGRDLPVARWRAWLSARLRALLDFWRRVERGTVELVQAGLRRLRPPTPPAIPWPYLGLRRLSPRDQVRFYYQALLRRAREGALPRRPGQTPFEYARDLGRALPDEAEPLAALTAAFVEARYSLHTVEPQQARRARGWWQALRAALRRRRKKV